MTDTESKANSLIDPTIARFQSILPRLPYNTGHLSNPGLLDSDIPKLPELSPKTARTPVFVLRDSVVLASTLNRAAAKGKFIEILRDCTVILDDHLERRTLLNCTVLNATRLGATNRIAKCLFISGLLKTSHAKMSVDTSRLIDTSAECWPVRICVDECSFAIHRNKFLNLAGYYIRCGCVGAAKVGPLGHDHRTVNILLDRNQKPYVRAGCFFGTLREFQYKCAKKYGAGSNYSKAVTAVAKDLVEEFKPVPLDLSLAANLLAANFLNKDPNPYKHMETEYLPDTPRVYIVTRTRKETPCILSPN